MSYENTGPFTFSGAPNTVGPYASIPFTITFDPSTGGSFSGYGYIDYPGLRIQISVSATYAAPQGMINPKYLILSVQYAPPGAKSVVDYGQSTNQGTTTSVTDMFSQSGQVAVTVKTPTFTDIFGIPGGEVPNVGITSTFSNTDTQEMDSTQTLAITKMSSYDTTVLGPASNSAGLDHNSDTVTIWLNPVVAMDTPSSSSLEVTNIYWDTRDGCDAGTKICNGAPGMDTITLSIAQLLNPALITDQFQLNQLARNWAPNESDGSLPGLTAADLQSIAAADPFTDPTFNPTFTVYADGTCSNASGSASAGRFCVTTNSQIQYASPQQGGQSGSTIYKNSYTVMATEAQKTIDTHQIQFSVDVNASAGFLSDWSVDVKDTTTLTWQHTWSKETSNTTSNSVSVTIVPPGFSDNYNGPTEFAVYQDSIYGTFMFWPVPFPGWLLSATPSSVTVTAGGKATFNVSTTAVDGGTGTVSLSVSGLPSGASATLSPSSVAVGNSSTLSVSTSSLTPAGSYMLTVSGAVGTNLPHSVQVKLVVKPGPSFSITASPSSRTVTSGQKTSYSISTTALNGFSGSIALTLAGLPSGASATFSPTSINGTGSSTLSVSTSGSTPAGSYTLTITGTSGSIVKRTSTTLVVMAAVPDFTISVTPGSVGVTAGGSAKFTVSTTAVNGFNGSISLSLGGLPSGASATFSPTSITGSGSSTLTVHTSTSTPKGTSTLKITGTSGSLTHSTTATLTVD